MPVKGNVLQKYHGNHTYSMCLLVYNSSIEFEELQDTLKQYAVQPHPQFRNLLYDVFNLNVIRRLNTEMQLVNV